MQRRIILVDLYWTRDKDPRVPLGHASLATALRGVAGVDVRTVIHAVNAKPLAHEAIAEEILAHAEGLPPGDVDVALGTYVWAESLIQSVLAALRRKRFGGRTVLGGPQISYAPAGIDHLYPGADAFVRGYGEAAMCELAQHPGRPRIHGVHYAGTVDLCEQATVDLQALASPWLTGGIPLAGQEFVRWETQRGCPFRCSFCQHREAGARLVRRALAADRIQEEVDLFCRSQVRDIAVLDPIFNLDGRATEVLGRFAERRFTGRLSVQCRAELVDEAFLEATDRLNIRLEFGLQTIHDLEGRAIRRQNRIDKVDAVLADVRRRGIDHEVSLIYGLPEQTLASFVRTVEWCLERHTPVIKAFPLLLLRGTALDRDRSQWGLVEDGGSMAAVVASSTFSHADWQAMSRIAEALRLTEGRHPSRIGDLLRLAGELEPNEARWRSSREFAA